MMNWEGVVWALVGYVWCGIALVLYMAITRTRQFFAEAWYVILIGSAMVIVGWLPGFLYFYTEDRLAKRRSKRYQAEFARLRAAAQAGDGECDQSEPFVP